MTLTTVSTTVLCCECDTVMDTAHAQPLNWCDRTVIL